MDKKEINIGVIGCGTVGSTVIEELERKKQYFKEKTGITFRIARISDKDKKKRKIAPDKFTVDPEDIVSDPSIHIVVELIGGVNPAYTFITKAIKNKKSLVTANKALLSERGEEIFRLADENRVHLGFEASVVSAVPVIKSLRETFLGNKISNMYGILNGTTNYILSQMTHRSMEFDDALKEAQKKGYAEADPSLDIAGMDTAHKFCILVRFAFNKSISEKDIFVEGLKNIKRKDIEFAAAMGYKVKLMAIAKRIENNLEVRVHPTLIPIEHVLSPVENVYNAVFLEGDLMGKSLLYGKGAGGAAAASSIISDIIEIGLKIESQSFKSLEPVEDDELKILPFGEISTRYYFRFTLLDKPGVLAKITKVLGDNDISIDSAIQKEKSPKKAVPVVILTHASKEKKVEKAIRLINKMSVVKKPTVVIRIED